MNLLILRQWHGYLGAFIAPSVILFSLTGALQLFNLHEAHGDYRPLQLLEKLGRVHKDQVFAVDHDHGTPPEDAKKPISVGEAAAPGGDDQPATPTMILKWFFLFVALGLVVSTLLGMWIGLTRSGRRATMVALSVAGCAIPLALLAIA